jgi:choline dehydrogenase
VTYDTIVVGAGSAGCAIAARLSEDPARRVLLLEAGGADTSILIRMPAAVARAIASPRYNWHYHTVPQAHMNGRRIYWPRGRVLGGSSSINAMVMVRGHPSDYDGWRAAGCPGWDWDDVLPFFRKMETSPRGPSAWRGGDGPVHIADPESGNQIFAAFIEAGRQAGFPVCDDFNGGPCDGFGPFQLNIKDGERWSAARAYLDPARERRNLAIRAGALVTRLTFDGTRCTGVRLAESGREESITAGEVILCGGTINTPQLLMLSGIGEAEHLMSLGVGVVAHRPEVGRNLQDHLEVKTKHRSLKPVTMWRHAKFPNYLWTGLQYLALRRGAGRGQGLEAGAFVRLDPQSAAPDTQLHFINALAFDGATAADRGHGFAIDVTQLRPESRGTIRLRSADPAEHPLIDPGYLAAETDRRMMRDGLKLLREICAQPAMAPYVGEELRPGPSVTTDAQLDALVRATADSIYHPVGTCRMGTDTGAVVDPRTMRVHGLDGLRVADASIMPTLVSGNTNGPVIMIGERAAALIQASGG